MRTKISLDTHLHYFLNPIYLINQGNQINQTNHCSRLFNIRIQFIPIFVSRKDSKTDYFVHQFTKV